MHARLGILFTVLAATAVAVVASLAANTWSHPAAQERTAQRSFSITARKYAYDPARIEVQQNDLVKITLRAADIPHSFTIDAYRISKRAGAGQTVTFEFRADTPGVFPFYCDLHIDEGCRKMRGELVVR